MHTEVHNAVTAADQGTQYDESAKRLLGQKSILAQILVRTVDEFKGMNPRYVETLIEGEPYISRIPLEPGLTNQEVMKAEAETIGKAKQNTVGKEKLKFGERIIGLNTENQEHAEGLVRFDIVFYVRIPSPDKEENKTSKRQGKLPVPLDIISTNGLFVPFIDRQIIHMTRLSSSGKWHVLINHVFPFLHVKSPVKTIQIPDNPSRLFTNHAIPLGVSLLLLHVILPEHIVRFSLFPAIQS